MWSEHTNVVSTDPPNIGTTTSNRRLSVALSTGRSKSRTITFVVTRTPASLHTRAAALSSANTRHPNAPVLVQKARPQLHVSRDRGSWRRRRRNNTTLNKCGGIVVSAEVGDVVRAKLSPAPLSCSISRSQPFKKNFFPVLLFHS